MPGWCRLLELAEPAGDDRCDLFDLTVDPTDPPGARLGDGMLDADPGQPLWTLFAGHTDLFLGRAADDRRHAGIADRTSVPARNRGG